MTTTRGHEAERVAFACQAVLVVNLQIESAIHGGIHSTSVFSYLEHTFLIFIAVAILRPELARHPVGANAIGRVSIIVVISIIVIFIIVISIIVITVVITIVAVVESFTTASIAPNVVHLQLVRVR